MTGDATKYDGDDASDLVEYGDEAYDQWLAEQKEKTSPEQTQSGGAGTGADGGGGSGDDTGGAGPARGRPRRGRGRGSDSNRLPTAMRVRADIEWAGESRGPRTSRLEGLDLAEYFAALGRAGVVRGKASAARPPVTYRARGWAAQLRQLEATKHGRAALSRAGMDASPRSRSRWRAGTGGASKARRKQISEAYDDARMWRVRGLLANATAANKDVTDMLNDALRDAYGVEIRLFDIQSMEYLAD